MPANSSVIEWLLGSDPSIRWQVMRDLTGAPEAEIAAERDRKGGAAWTRFAFPTWWHYDVLRGLDYLRRAGVAPDERVAEAIDLVASKRDEQGRWPLETRYPGRMPVETDEGEGRASRWNTLRALRVLDWYSEGDLA